MALRVADAATAAAAAAGAGAHVTDADADADPSVISAALTYAQTKDLSPDSNMAPEPEPQPEPEPEPEPELIRQQHEHAEAVSKDCSGEWFPLAALRAFDPDGPNQSAPARRDYVEGSHGGLRPGQPVQVLDESDLHSAVEGSQYSVEEVLEWSGCRGSVVMVRDEEAAARVDFSTELMKRAIDSKTEANQLRSALVAEREAGSELRSALDKEKVRRTSFIVDPADAANANKPGNRRRIIKCCVKRLTSAHRRS